jgi:PIG-X / PBN1
MMNENIMMVRPKTGLSESEADRWSSHNPILKRNASRKCRMKLPMLLLSIWVVGCSSLLAHVDCEGVISVLDQLNFSNLKNGCTILVAQDFSINTSPSSPLVAHYQSWNNRKVDFEEKQQFSWVVSNAATTPLNVSTVLDELLINGSMFSPQEAAVQSASIHPNKHFISPHFFDGSISSSTSSLQELVSSGWIASTMEYEGTARSFHVESISSLLSSSIPRTLFSCKACQSHLDALLAFPFLKLEGLRLHAVKRTEGATTYRCKLESSWVVKRAPTDAEIGRLNDPSSTGGDHSSSLSRSPSALRTFPGSALCRSVPSVSGFHKNVSYSFSLTLPVATSDPVTDAARAIPTALRPSNRSSCHLLLLQRVLPTWYVDLDELRQAERFNGARVKSFSRFIDVERPASDSRQHLLALALPVLPPRAEVETDRPGAMRDSARVSFVDNGRRLVVTGSASFTFHLRYAAPMHCDATTASFSSTTVPANPTESISTLQYLALSLHELGKYLGSFEMSLGSVLGLEKQQPPPRARATPYLPGCYRSVSAPVPDLFLQCADHGLSSLGSELEALQRTAYANASLGELEKGGWRRLLVEIDGDHGEAVAHDCVDSLSYVPVGILNHRPFVEFVSFLLTVGGSFLVILVTLTRS